MGEKMAIGLQREGMLPRSLHVSSLDLLVLVSNHDRSKRIILDPRVA